MLTGIKKFFNKQNFAVLSITAFLLAGVICTHIHGKETFVSLNTGREEKKEKDEDKKDEEKKEGMFSSVRNEVSRVRERLVDKTKARYNKFCRDNNI